MAIRNLVACFAVALASCVSPSPVDTDISPTGRLKEWLSIYNRNNEDALKTLLESSFVPDPKRLLRQRLARQMSQRYELRRINEVTANRVVAELASPGTEQRFGVALEVDGSPSNKVSRFVVERLASQLGEQEAVRRGDTYVSQLAERGDFSGVVLLARDEEIVYQGIYGMADREAGIPITAETRFSSASVGKMFTAVAILQLAQAGKLDLNVPFGTYLPDYPNESFARTATIHQLLSHTSGTGDIDWPVTPEDDARQLETRTLGDYITRYGPRSPAFPPGSGWVYSNFGYVILGRIIEAVSGQDYYSYVIEHVFRPAQMNDSGFPTADDTHPNAAVPYTKIGGQLTAVRRKSFYRAMPAGGAAVSAPDLVHFANALIQHRLLDAHHLELMTLGKTDLPRGGIYGYGVLDDRAQAGAWFGHAGGAPGISTELRIYPWNGYVVVALSNFDPPITDNVVQELADWLPR